ncbi:MAG: MarR family transcriptional regulator [Nocardioides sp.]|nr:MarR family transcriptional regulator [Nocardioides sp.]
MSANPREQFVDDISAYFSAVGFPRMAARVFAHLLGTDQETLTARDLADQIGVSPAAISGAVRYLGQVALIRRTRSPGERKDRFGLGTNVWESAMTAEQAAFPPLITMCEQALSDVDFAAGPRARIEEARDFMRFMQAEMPLLMEKWRAQRG